MKGQAFTFGGITETRMVIYRRGNTELRFRIPDGLTGGFPERISHYALTKILGEPAIIIQNAPDGTLKSPNFERKRG